MHVSKMRVRNALGAAVMSALVVGATGHAQAADRFVSTAGGDTGNDCLSSATPCATPAHALTQAASGDIVKVSAGHYPNEEATVTFSTTVSGGWTADFTSRNPVINRTVLEDEF